MASASVVGMGPGGNWQSYAGKFLRDLAAQMNQQQSFRSQLDAQTEAEKELIYAREEAAKNVEAYGAEAKKIAEQRGEETRRTREKDALDAFRNSLAPLYGGGSQPNAQSVVFQPQAPVRPQIDPMRPFTGNLPGLAPETPPAQVAGGGPQNKELDAAMAIATLAIYGSPQAAEVASLFVERGLLPPAMAQMALEVKHGLRTEADVATQAAVTREGHGVDLERIASNERIAGLNANTVKGGSYIPLTDDRGNIIGAWNPTRGDFQEPPVEGARKSGLSGTEMTRRSLLTVMQSQMNDLEEIANRNKGAIGFVEGKVADIKRRTVGTEGEVNDLFRLANNVSDVLLRARSGAQINEQEYKRLRSLVPNPRDPETKFFADLASFKNEVAMLMEMATGGGQSVGASADAGVSAGEQTKTTPDGRQWRKVAGGWEEIK